MYSAKGTGMRTARRKKTVSVATATRLIKAVGAGPRTGAFGRSGGIHGSGGFGGMSRALPQYRQSELKVVDNIVSSYALNATGTFKVQNACVNGAAFYNRIGNEIQMKSLHLFGNLQLTGNAAAPNQEYIRIMVVYDRQPNGSYPVVADVLTSYSISGATSSTSYDSLNPNNFDRFRVLADIRLATPVDSSVALTIQTAAIIDYKGEYNINRFINLRGLSTKYKASAGAIGDIASGALLVFTLGNVVAGSESYSADLTARLRFID
nr:MAG: capsid protein [Cressdnaviricota sp.]